MVVFICYLVIGNSFPYIPSDLCWVLLSGGLAWDVGVESSWECDLNLISVLGPLSSPSYDTHPHVAVVPLVVTYWHCCWAAHEDLLSTVRSATLVQSGRIGVKRFPGGWKHETLREYSLGDYIEKRYYSICRLSLRSVQVESQRAFFLSASSVFSPRISTGRR